MSVIECPMPNKKFWLRLVNLFTRSFSVSAGCRSVLITMLIVCHSVLCKYNLQKNTSASVGYNNSISLMAFLKVSAKYFCIRKVNSFNSKKNLKIYKKACQQINFPWRLSSDHMIWKFFVIACKLLSQLPLAQYSFVVRSISALSSHQNIFNNKNQI